MSASSAIAIWADGITTELKQRCQDNARPRATNCYSWSPPCCMSAAPILRNWPLDCQDSRSGGIWAISGYIFFLENARVSCDVVMQPFASDILARAVTPGEPVPLILDQSKLSDRHQVLMLSVRWGERALPVAWRVEETEGAIGFST